MIIIKSCEELRRLLANFSYEEIGFEKIREDDNVAEYYKARQHRSNLLAKVNRRSYESVVYLCNGKYEPMSKKGTFNLRRQEEVLFLLTHCLNELKVEQHILEQCKGEIGYDQTNVIPGRAVKAF